MEGVARVFIPILPYGIEDILCLQNIYLFRNALQAEILRGLFHLTFNYAYQLTLAMDVAVLQLHDYLMLQCSLYRVKILRWKNSLGYHA